MSRSVVCVDCIWFSRTKHVRERGLNKRNTLHAWSGFVTTLCDPLGKSPDFFSFYFLIDTITFIHSSLGKQNEITVLASPGKVCNHTYGTEKKVFMFIWYHQDIFMKQFFERKYFDKTLGLQRDTRTCMSLKSWALTIVLEKKEREKRIETEKEREGREEETTILFLKY